MGPSAFGGLETREPLTEAQIDGIARGLLVQLSLDEKISTYLGREPWFNWRPVEETAHRLIDVTLRGLTAPD